MEFSAIFFLALESAKGLEPSPKNILRIAEQFGPDTARWAFEQWELRKRAKAKFAQAEEMLFVREALEQATHEQVAENRASRFPKNELVLDLTAGIGADLIALSRRGPAMGYEIDPERAACARHNSGVEVREHDSLTADWEAEYAIADPARRIDGRRSIDPNDFEPNPFHLAERMKKLKSGCIKLSPMIRDSQLSELGDAIEFWSYGRECREASVWRGTEARKGIWAVHVESGEMLEGGTPTPGRMKKPCGFIYDPDPSVIRAHALAAFKVSLLGDSNWLTSEDSLDSVWLRKYAVIWDGKFQSRAFDAALKEYPCFEIKQSGAGIDIEKVKKSLKIRGSQGHSLLLWQQEMSLRCAIGVHQGRREKPHKKL